MIFIMIAVGDSPWNGRRPASSSYMTMPAEKMSLRPSIVPPDSCSGDM